MAVLVPLEAGRPPVSAHAAMEAERVYDDLVGHIEDCERGCWPWRDAPWRRDNLCELGRSLVDDYAAAVLRASTSALDAGTAVAVRLGYPAPLPRPVVLP